MNPDELAICKRRGHDPSGFDRWRKCKWCGLWQRSVRVLEEREEEPPESEQSPLEALENRVAAQKKKDQKKSVPEPVPSKTEDSLDELERECQELERAEHVGRAAADYSRVLSELTALKLRVAKLEHPAA